MLPVMVGYAAGTGLELDSSVGQTLNAAAMSVSWMVELAAKMTLAMTSLAAQAALAVVTLALLQEASAANWRQRATSIPLQRIQRVPRN